MNNFIRHTFSMSKSSIKTETVLTMTDTTEPTEPLAFKRRKDGYKVTVKISMCISVVLSYQPFANVFPWSSFTQMACYNQEFCSRLIADGFACSFGQHKSVKRALAFGVSAYWSRNTVYSSLHRGAHIWFSYIHNHYSILIGWRILIGQTSLNGSTGQYPQLLNRLNCTNCTI